MDEKLLAFLKAFDAWAAFPKDDLEMLEYEELEELQKLEEAMFKARDALGDRT